MNKLITTKADFTPKNTHTPVQNEKVFKWWDYPLFILLTGLIFFGLFNFMKYWFSFYPWLNYPLSFMVMTLMIIIILVNYLGRWFLLPHMRRPRQIKAELGWKVGVVTTIVPSAESIEMLEETLKAMVAVDYPHDTWVLDEENDERVKKLCENLGVNHFSRTYYPQYQTENGTFQSHSKYGNYNAWLYEIGFDRYDIISAFDPDHRPNENFLSKVLGYFEDPKVGYVQVAPAYYNQKASFIARGAAEETYAYHSSVQMASYAMEYPIIIGSHNTHRVTALKEVGGFAPHDADDLLITLLYRKNGWQGVYVPKILARGLTPVAWNGYLTQQRRWARSVLDIKLRQYAKAAKDLPLRSRVFSFLHGLNYLYRSITILTGLILMMFMLITGSVPAILSIQTGVNITLLYLILQACDFYRQRFYLDWRNEWGWHWRIGVLQIAKWPFFILALCDIIINRQIAYVITKKIKLDTDRSVILWPHTLIIISIATAGLIGFISGQITNPFLYIGAAAIVLSSLALILTTAIKFPAPFDRDRLS